MSEVTVEQLARTVGTPPERLLEQLRESGLPQSKISDVISDRDKSVLLAHLRGIHSSKPSKIVKKKVNKLVNTGSSKRKQSFAIAKKIVKKQLIDEVPKVFISYSYDSNTHKKWVEQLASMLRADGVETILDKWFLHPGDPITIFMEKGISEADYVLIICTEKYKTKSDAREGGVGYEEAIISSDMFVNSNHRKYIPILKSDNYNNAMPKTLHSKLYINLSNEEEFSESYRDLLLTLFSKRPSPPPIGKAPGFVSS